MNKTGIIILLFLVLEKGLSQNQTFYNLPNGQITTIDEWNECRKVTNNTGNAIFIPTNTSGEWLSFINNFPTGIILDACEGNCQSTAIFYDGFENGYSNWSSGSGSFTAGIDNTDPYAGQQCLYMSGAPGHNNGLYNVFGNSTPSYISYSVKTTNTTNYNSYVAIRIDGLDFIWFSFSYFRNGQLRFVVEEPHPNSFDTYTSGGITYWFLGLNSVSANQWYFVEFKNIDWNTESYDLYINNNLVAPNAPFRDKGVFTAVNRIDYFHVNSTLAYFDEITICP